MEIPVYYYTAFGRRDQDEEEFLATSVDVVRSLVRELKRLPPNSTAQGRRALDIGCGPGRLLRPLSQHLTEIHGVDVSDEMVCLAREKLHDIPHVRVHLNDGVNLASFPDNYFDFIYSYAVFQHIPSREVVFNYLEEARRVLKTGGYLRCQINGLPATSKYYDTWNGVRISACEIAGFAREHHFQLLALEGASTQYMWTTMRKQPAGWRPRFFTRIPEIRRITNAYSSEPVVPSRGRFACVSLWLEGLPDDCDLNNLEAIFGDARGVPFYIGPPEIAGLQQFNIALPQPIRTGLLPLEVLWVGKALIRTTVRAVAPGPAVPRLISITDGINLLSGPRIFSRIVKVTLEEICQPEELRASIEGVPCENVDFFCTDPVPPRYEINLTIPAVIRPGAHELYLELGSRRFAPIPIEVAASP